MKNYVWRIFMLPFFMMASTLIVAQKAFVRTGQNIRISEPVAGNTYMAAAEAFIDSGIAGDLMGVVGSVQINARIRKDILLAVGKINLNAETGEDVRILGGDILISKFIKGDLLIAGGKVLITDEAIIGGEVIVAGGDVTIGGTINGDLHIVGGKVQLQGRVIGNLSTHSGKLYLQGSVDGSSKIVAQSLTIGSEARFGQEVRYWTNEGKVEFGTSLSSNATAIYDNNLRPAYANVNWEKGIKAALMTFMILRILSGILLVGMLIALFSRFFAARAGLARKYAGRSFARGLTLLLALPVLSVLALVTVVGIPLGIIGFSAFTVFALSAGAVTAIVVAYEWAQMKNMSPASGKIFLIALGVFILLRLVGLIPVIGNLANFILAAVALGHIFRHYSQEGPVPTPKSAQEDGDLV